jgi:2'-5' RNA ligase
MTTDLRQTIDEQKISRGEAVLLLHNVPVIKDASTMRLSTGLKPAAASPGPVRSDAPLLHNGRSAPGARMFFALWPGPALRPNLAHWASALQRTCGGRVMHSDNLHMTLVFIGTVALARMEELQQLALRIAPRRFDLELAGAQFWKRNRLVCATPSSVPRQLAALVAEIEAALASAGFAFDRREYLPHMTLVRDARRPPQPSATALLWQVRNFVLLRSCPVAQGVRYEVLGEWGG